MFNMGKMLFIKKVDKSLLKAGLTIPVASCEEVINALHAPLRRGEKQDIDIILNGTIYRATFTHVDMHAADRDVFQIRYAEGSPISLALKNRYLSPESAKEEDAYVEVWSADNSLEFKCYPNSLKDSFMKYLGPEDSLYGYQKSYKLVFYKCYFSEALYDERIDVDVFTKQFRQFYIDRRRAGLSVEIGTVDNVLLNVNKSSVDDYYSLILKNPFNAINKKNFFMRQIVDGKSFFAINSELFNSLKDDDLERIRNLVHKKLVLYYSNNHTKSKPIDLPNNVENRENEDKAVENNLIETPVPTLKVALEKFINEYSKESKKSLTGNPFASFIRKGLPEVFFKTGLVNKTTHLVVGSVGQGNWATIPWLCIFDTSVTTSAQEGVYIVYLLSKDTNRLYLTFNQGCTNLRKQFSKRETIRRMREEAERIIAKSNPRGFKTDDRINLGENLTELGLLYQKGTIFYKEYKKGAIPEESELEDDLKKMLDIYADYAHPKAPLIDLKTSETAWLLTWNPQNWNWNDYAAGIEASRSGEKYEVTWSCSNTHVKAGDKMYLMILGNNGVKGIIAAGHAISKVFEVPHWDYQKAKSGKKTNGVKVSFDTILDFRSDPILSIATLQIGRAHV